MKFWEAMKHLEEGKKIRRSDWVTENWISKDECFCGAYDCCLYFMREETHIIEWELYEKPVQLLSFSEIVQGLREGKRFRRLGWTGNLGLYILLKSEDDGIEKFQIMDSCGNFPSLTMFDFEATDWIEIK